MSFCAFFLYSSNVLARLLLLLALLAAQQAALSHQLWHLDSERGQPAQQALCDFHDALTAVAGVLQGAPPRLELPAASEAAVPPARGVVAPAQAVAPSSRGPPCMV